MADNNIIEIMKLNKQGRSLSEIAAKFEMDEDEVKRIILMKEMMQKLNSERKNKKKTLSSNISPQNEKVNKKTVTPNKIKESNENKINSITKPTENKLKIKYSSTELPSELIKLRQIKEKESNIHYAQEKNYEKEIIQLLNEGFSISDISKKIKIEKDEVERINNKLLQKKQYEKERTTAIELNKDLSYDDIKLAAKKELEKKSVRCRYRLMLFEYVYKNGNEDLSYTDILFLSDIIKSNITMYNIDNVKLVVNLLINYGKFADSKDLISYCKYNYRDKYGISVLIDIETEISSKYRIRYAIELYKKGCSLEEIKLKSKVTDLEYEKFLKSIQNIKNEESIKKTSKIIETENKLKSNNKIKTSKKTNLKNYFDVSFEDLNEAINRLSKKQKEFIKEKYDENLELKQDTILTNKDEKNLYNIIRRLRQLINDPELGVDPNKYLFKYNNEEEKQKLLSAIEQLYYKQQDFIEEYYDKDIILKNGVELNRSQKNYIIKIRTVIGKIISGELDNIRHPKSRVNIYTYYLGHSKEEVDIAISKLSETQRKFIEKVYDEDGNKKFELEKSEKSYLTFVLDNIYKFIKSEKTFKKKSWNNLNEYFSGYDNIHEVISSLDEERSKKFYKYYDENYIIRKTKHDKRESDEIEVLLKYIERRIKGIKERPKYGNYKDLNPYFNECSYEEKKELIKLFKKSIKDFIDEKYDENLKLKSDIVLTDEEINFAKTSLVAAIKRKSKRFKNTGELKRYTYESLYEYGKLRGNKTREEVDEIIQNISDEDRIIFDKVYDENLCKIGNVKLTEEERKIISHIVYNKIGKKTKTKNSEDKLKKEEETLTQKTEETKLQKVNDIDYDKIIKVFNRPEFIEFTKNKTFDECIIMSLKLGYIDGKCYSTNEIAEFLGMEILSVNHIIQKNLSEYKKELLKLIDKAVNLNIENTYEYNYN